MKTYVYDKDCNLIKTYLDGTEEEIRAMEGQEVYLSDVVFINPILDNENIREMKVTEMIKAGIIVLFDGQYLKNEEIVTVEKPNDFYSWDSKKHKWNYDKQFEINFLNNDLASLESTLLSKYDELDKAIARKLKTLEKRLNAEIKELTVLIEEKYIKLEELEAGHEN